MKIPKPYFKPFNPLNSVEITDNTNSKSIILEDYERFYIAFFNNKNEKIYLSLKDIYSKEIANAK